MVIENFKESTEALRSLTLKFIDFLNRKNNTTPFNLALSGGETAKQMFSLWSNQFRSHINWENIRFFWVDERCVPPQSSESNYGQAHKLLFEPLGIPQENIYRIRGEEEPEVEAVRYSQIVKELLPVHDNLPHFDCIILGIGGDAHTASIFPDRLSLLTDNRIYAVSQQPVTDQYRITMTGPVILNSSPLLIPVIGSGKTKVIDDIKKIYSTLDTTPAAYILSHAMDATIYASHGE